MKAMKKIWRYIKQYKKLLYISLIMLVLNQVLGLLSPLIVKEILDEHIMGIEFPWYQVAEEGEHTVYFNGDYYKQERYFGDGETKGKQVSVFTHKSNFYFVYEPIIEGKKTIDDQTLTVVKDEITKTYSISKLDYEDVIDFYKPSFFMLKILVLLLLARSILSIIIGYIQRISTANLNINMVRDARLDAIKKVGRLPINYFEQEPAGKLSNRIIHDVGGMMMLLGTLINLVINASMSFIFAYIGMFYLDAKLALISFVIYPIVYIWLRFFIKKLRKVATKVNELNSLITASLNEIINGISILQIFNYKKQTSKRFDTLNKAFMGEHIKEIKLHTTLGWNMINFLRGIVTAAIIVYFGYGYLNVEGMVISAGLIYAYNEYLLKLIDPLNILFRQVGNLQHAVVRTERIFKIIDGEVEDNTKEVIPRYKGRIQFENVWFAYHEQDYVIKDINLNIEPGQVVGLVGHTGSGKSSLMSLLLRFYDLKPTDKGKILVDGIDITNFSKPTYRQHIGIILQDPVLFKGTIASNVRFGANDITDEQIEEILIHIGAKQLLDKFDKGIHQEVSRAGSNLSVGEKQLISFARALIYNPSILVMDEATANIDTETETLIQNALDIVSKGRTMIIIAHRLSTIKNADKIVVLNNGEKFEEGSHKELIINNGIYANIYRSQV
ncbi:ABC transporter ATP-binding protein [Haloplasma contractile]|uniref:ATP-binding cassette subfamily B bacterial MsbA protein n=1 Tax=Haloplasma contractile SSD-17B TaxID=1033810 RepID=F7Q1H6_9MOLU|nr:ABC transporter ATP-binding protein [Haloplasma contractile]ERJ12901.1 ATP-binding cassette subfamily B bacterial MsbA protein [Haloplasma contractile SSD-17B]